MTDITERLHVVRDQLRTGRFGQREVWEEWLTEAAAEITRLTVDNEQVRALMRNVSATRDTAVNMHLADIAEIERLRALLHEPTPEMLDAAERYNHEHITGEWSFADLYKAMTAVALEPIAPCDDAEFGTKP